MDPAFYALIAVVVVLYAAFVSWRVRVHRGRRASASGPSTTRRQRGLPAEQPDTDARLARALDAAARLTGQAPAPTAGSRQPIHEPGSVPPLQQSSDRSDEPPGDTRDAPEGRAQGPSTVAELLAGIRLPSDLAPLTTMESRAGAGDRVAFWTARTPAEVAAPALVDSLLAIGCTVARLAPSTYTIERHGSRAVAVVHPDGGLAKIDGATAFPSLPENAVVVEIWLPA